MEHPSPEALKKYLKEHPGADPKNHKVKETEGAKEPKSEKIETISDPKGGEHHVVQAGGGNSVFMGSHTAKHIKEHNKPGKGSVFAKGADVDAILDTVSSKVPEDFFSKGGGVFTMKVPGKPVGKDLVQKTEDIRKKHPNALEIKIEKQEGVVMEDDPDNPGKKRPKKGKDGKPIPNMISVSAFVLDDKDDGSEYDTNEVNVVMRPANPQFLPEEAQGAMKGAIADKKGFAVLTAFPGNPDVPKTSDWKDDWAVIIPSGGSGADEDVQEAIKKAKGSKTARLRSKLIRLAHRKPELRPHLLPLLKTAGSFPRVEREIENDYRRRAITVSERTELLRAIEDAETEREAMKIVSDHRKFVQGV
jgi:hypothetical protein